MYDRICKNNHKLIDCLEPITAPEVRCPECFEPTDRAWLSKPAAVIGDDIPGGLVIRHGVCWPDGSPRKFYSKSEIARVAKELGVVNYVEHVTAPGTDKSKETTRWV